MQTSKLKQSCRLKILLIYFTKNIRKKLRTAIPSGSSQKVGDSKEWLLARVYISQSDTLGLGPSGSLVTRVYERKWCALSLGLPQECLLWVSSTISSAVCEQDTKTHGSLERERQRTFLSLVPEITVVKKPLILVLHYWVLHEQE